jgi:hypothetical protein
MRATVSDEALAEQTLAWAAEGLSINSQERVYRAMGLALIDLQHDLTPSRYDEQVFANDAVAAVATLMGRIVPKHMWTELQKEPWCKQLVSCGLLPAHFARGTRIQIDAL